jgi:hypothetical protein
MDHDRQRLGQFAVVCLAVALAALWCMVQAGCVRAEAANPPPSSSRAPGDFNAIVIAWLAVAPGNSWSAVKPTGSMLPLFGSNSVLLLERSNGADLAVGDIALYARGDALIAHRVRATSQTAALFTGDNNDPLRPDGWIAHERIRYRVAGILYAQR